MLSKESKKRIDMLAQELVRERLMRNIRDETKELAFDLSERMGERDQKGDPSEIANYYYQSVMNELIGEITKERKKKVASMDNPTMNFQEIASEMAKVASFLCQAATYSRMIFFCADKDSAEDVLKDMKRVMEGQFKKAHVTNLPGDDRPAAVMEWGETGAPDSDVLKEFEKKIIKAPDDRVKGVDFIVNGKHTDNLREFDNLLAKHYG